MATQSGYKSAKNVAAFISTQYPERVKKALAFIVQKDPGFMLKSLENFQDKQISNKFWNNQTFQALQGMKVLPITENNRVGWIMYNTVSYALYLELANNRKHAAIAPITEFWGAAYIAFAEKMLAPGTP